MTETATVGAYNMYEMFEVLIEDAIKVMKEKNVLE